MGSSKMVLKLCCTCKNSSSYASLEEEKTKLSMNSERNKRYRSVSAVEENELVNTLSESC